MKQDIILSGVGGQGILTIATIIGKAATAKGLSLKQAEVHGMSQRGGDVQSNLRLSTSTIHSDLIALASADLIIAMEPIEALRYLPYLRPEGAVVSSSAPFKNVGNYPESETIEAEFQKLPNATAADIDHMAKENHIPRSANVILLGMAAHSIEILTPEELREAVASTFAHKGETIVNQNLKAFDLGYACVQ